MRSGSGGGYFEVLWIRHVTKDAGRVSKESEYNRFRGMVPRVFFWLFLWHPCGYGILSRFRRTSWKPVVLLFLL